MALAILGAFVLSGCAGGESAPSSAAARGGVTGELVRQEEPEAGEAESSEAEPSEAESSEAEPSEAESSEAEPSEAESGEAESGEAESDEAESGEGELKELVDRETTPEQRQELREELERGAGEAEQEREAG